MGHFSVKKLSVRGPREGHQSGRVIFFFKMAFGKILIVVST